MLNDEIRDYLRSDETRNLFRSTPIELIEKLILEEDEESGWGVYFLEHLERKVSDLDDQDLELLASKGLSFAAEEKRKDREEKIRLVYSFARSMF